MARLKISFNPLFLIFAFILIYFGWLAQFLIYIFVLLLHEMAHYIVAKMYGYKLNKIIFMPYGAGLSGESNIFKPSHEVLIALAGPLLNMFLALICIALWWLVPIVYAYTETFVMANLVLGIFNLLPIFPLDGGRVLVALFSTQTSKVKIYKVMRIIGLVFSAFFAILFVLSVFYKINLTLIFISIFLFISSFDNVKDVYFERTNLLNFSKNVDRQKALEMKTYAVSYKMPLLKLVKYIRGNNLTQFVVLDDDGKVIKTLNEFDIKKFLKLNNDKS